MFDFEVQAVHNTNAAGERFLAPELLDEIWGHAPHPHLSKEDTIDSHEEEESTGTEPDHLDGPARSTTENSLSSPTNFIDYLRQLLGSGNNAKRLLTAAQDTTLQSSKGVEPGQPRPPRRGLEHSRRDKVVPEVEEGPRRSDTTRVRMP